MPHRTPLLREVLRTFLADYICLIEPDALDHLDLARITFPDLADLPGWTAEERGAHGVVGEVPARWGEKVTLLVQVEIDALTPAELARRIGDFFMDLEIHYCQPVFLSVLYVRGGRPGINLETAPVCRILGMDILRLYFTSFGVAKCRAEYFLERPEPLAWALSTLMEPAHRSREEHLRLSREKIAAGRMPEEHRALLERFVDAFVE
jgi:hypothetical protein